MKKTFLETLNTRPLFIDGAMGTLLQSRGLGPGELPELWNVTHPEVLLDIHRAYLDAGADILLANTFGANRFKLERESGRVAELVTAAISLAKEAAQGQAYVALDIGSTGKLLKPYGDLDFEDAYAAYAEMIDAGAAAGADLIVIETMSDIYETKAALLAAKEHSDLPVLVSLTFDESGKLLTGADIPTAAAVVEGLGADVIGLNCGLGPKQMRKLLPQLRDACSIPIAVSPNAGLPVVVDGKTCFLVEPEEFAADCRALLESGAAIVGGCCGTTPAHIAAMVNACRDTQILPPQQHHRTIVASYTHTVELGQAPLIIGERLNPTGKKALKQALRENNMDYLCREAIAQVDNGAHILDVNVGLPEIDEPAMLCGAVEAIQSVSDLPLQLDTSDADALAKALRIYNGRPLINSVNGGADSMAAVFPLAKKYGAAVVALTLDEGGIPDTAAGRIAIAEKILATAKTYGLSEKDLVVDALAMTVSTGPDNANIALETLDYVRHTLHMNTVLGVSNISFGLPHREKLNAAFFTMAMSRGLSAGIVNPGDENMMDAYRSYCALTGFDSHCAAYIAHYSAQAEEKKPKVSVSDMTLHQAVVRGLIHEAAEKTAALLETLAPLDIIDGELIPALDEVGAGFEAKKVFLPQLLMSADAAKAAFDVLKTHMTASGTAQEVKGRVILATVKGDVHDIGKNIVKTLLENYGFDVVDLGKDVAPEVIAETAQREDISLVGLSALMTTTVPYMEETIRLLRTEKPGCRVMVGGAVLTADYARQIGADFYGKDAMSTVRYAEEVFGA